MKRKAGERDQAVKGGTEAIQYGTSCTFWFAVRIKESSQWLPKESERQRDGTVEVVREFTTKWVSRG